MRLFTRWVKSLQSKNRPRHATSRSMSLICSTSLEHSSITIFAASKGSYASRRILPTTSEVWLERCAKCAAVDVSSAAGSSVNVYKQCLLRDQDWNPRIHPTGVCQWKRPQCAQTSRETELLRQSYSTSGSQNDRERFRIAAEKQGKNRVAYTVPGVQYWLKNVLSIW